MYFLIGWDHTNKLYLISESNDYNFIKYRANIEKVSDDTNDWMRVLIVQEVREHEKNFASK